MCACALSLRYVGVAAPVPCPVHSPVAAALCSFCEGKNLNDLGLLWLRNDCGLSPLDIGNYITVWGVCCLVSGMRFVPWLIKQLGMRHFTTVTTATTLGYCITSALVPTLSGGNRTRSLFWGYAAFAMLFPGINAGYASCLKGWGTSHAAANGLSAGEYSGYFANLRALTVTLAPLIYGRIYSSLAAARDRKGAGFVPSPGVAWGAAAVLGCVLPTLLWRSIPDKELDIPKAKRKKK